jgi:hypothetical protein
MKRALAGTDELFGAARRIANDANGATADRVVAVRILGRARVGQDADFELLAGLLGPHVPVKKHGFW